MREVELKSVVDDPVACARRVERAGATLVFSGALRDVRYDTPARDLVTRDQVLRLRVYKGAHRSDAHLDWKGETRYEQGYKVRDEISSAIGDAAALETIIRNLGFVVVREIEREIAQYELQGAMLRFEHYPRMDVLLEIEGSPEQIELAIASTGLPRGGFTAARLADFVAAYEARTGERAAVSARELRGDYEFQRENA